MASVLGVLKTIGTDTLKVGEFVVHEVEVVGHAAVAVEKVLTDANSMSPELKTNFSTLIADGEAIATALVSTGGNVANFGADLNALASVEKFVKDFLAMLPTLKADAAKIGADVAA